MAFVEYLRARGCFKILLIVYAALFVCSAVVILIVNAQLHRGENMIDHHKLSRAATITTERQADGSVKTVMNDPIKNRHIVVIDRGWFGMTLDVTQPTTAAQAAARAASISAGHRPHEHVAGASVSVTETQSGGMTHERINTDEPIGIGILFLIAMWPALVIATILSAPLAKENDGHLEIAFTLPVSRTRLALSMMLVDTIAIVISELISVVLIMACITLFQQPKFMAQPLSFALIVLALLAPITWYMMLNAATSSMRRSFGAIIGVAWPVALIVPGAAAIPVGGSLLGQILHVVMQGLAYLDPLYYIGRGGSIEIGSATTVTGLAMDQQLLLGLAAEVALAIAYGVVAILQWRRVEA